MSINKIRINQTQIGIKDGCVAAASVANPLTAAPLSVDGITAVAGMRMLVIGDGINSGVWVVVTPGSGSNGVWERPEDFADGDVLIHGTTVSVQYGTTYSRSNWTCASTSTTQRIDGMLIGTDTISVQQVQPSGFLWDGAIVFAQPMVGAIDGTNTVFTTGNSTGQDASIAVYLNGQVQVEGADYSLAYVSNDWEVTFVFPPKAAPGNPDVVTASYQYHLTL
jgi:hypothetical protein